MRLTPVLFALLLCQATNAQTVHPDLEKALNRALDSIRTVLNVKSLGAAVQLPNGAVWATSKGISALSPLDTVTPDHHYAIGSVTKTITAACILQLADEGLLSLDDSLHLWLETLPFVNPNITIRQLLRHQSGLYDVITDQAYNIASQSNIDSVWVLKNVLTTFMHAPLFQPGAGWSYSNTNFLLLGMIIEAVTGNDYYQEFRERFFTPLNLNSLSLPPYDALPSPIAHLWLDITGDNVPDDANNFFSNWRSFYSTAGPAGGYYATPADMAIWMKAFMTGTMHSPAIMAAAKTTVGTNLPSATKYGLGIMERKFSAMTCYGHGGDIGYSSLVYYFPVKDISVAILCNDSKSASWNSWALAPVMVSLLRAYIAHEAVTAVNEPSESNGVEMIVSPNPFVESLHTAVNLSVDATEMQLVLTNMMGETVAKNIHRNLLAGAQEMTWEHLEHLPTGVYFLNTVLDGRLLQTLKVVKY